jgi:LemA protein
MAASTIFLIVLGVLILGLIGGVVSIYNGLITVSNNVRKAWKNIDVVLQQRNDELPKLIETCKGYLKHEREMLTKITELRTGYAGAAQIQEKVRIENELANLLKQLRIVAEQYPDLKAVQGFLQIQERVSALESKIADYREAFNDVVNTYNIQIQRFPDLLLAKTMSYETHAFLEVPAEKKQDVKMDFS